MYPTTAEVFDLYYKEQSPETELKVRGQVDRPELYAYEKELDKQVFDMDVDELIQMLLAFNTDRKYGAENAFPLSMSSIDQIASTYRSIWNYYIDNIRIIRNPWNDKRMRGVALAKRMASERGSFDFDIVDKCIKRLYAEFPSDAYLPKYIEAIVLMYYNGFADGEQIAMLKEDMIDFENHDVIYEDYVLHLSDRCFEMLQCVHNMTEAQGYRTTYPVVSWHGSYFKFIVREMELPTFQGRDLRYVSAMLARNITRYIKRGFDVDLNYRTIYLLGFYNYIVGRAGEKRTKELITSVRSSVDTRELVGYAKEYGFYSDNSTNIKKCLRMFI